MIIPEPKIFYSYLDEKHFFYWLEEIPAVKNVLGVISGLELTIIQPLDQPNLRDLIAVMKRYQLDMTCLADFCTPENEFWFRDPEKYWHTDIFGKKSEEQ